MSPVFLAAVQLALLVETARDKADVWDESTYVTMGARQVAYGEVGMTPVPAWGFGAALALAGRVGEPPRQMNMFAAAEYAPQDIERFHGARWASLLVTVAAGLFLFLAARRFGEGAAVAAQALWCFSPNVLGNGALATLDVWVAAMLALALLALARFAERPTASRAALVAAALALAVGCKITAAGAVPIAFAAGWWRLRGLGGRMRCAAAFAAAFLFTLWAAYGFSVGMVSFASHPWNVEIGPVPFPMLWRSFVAQAHHGFVSGHTGFLWGELRSTGWWWFYLACAAFKLTPAAQATAVLIGAGWRGRGWRFDLALLAYPALLLAVMSAGKTQLGIRYLLPAFPFVMLVAGRALAHAFVAWGARGRALVALVALSGAGSVLTARPDHLAYTNLWAGAPAHATGLLIDGSDWCQDKRRLAAWQRENGVRVLYSNGCWTSLAAWGVSALDAPCAPTPGTYALFASTARRPYRASGCLDWLTAEEPDEVLAGTIYLYQVDLARIARLRDRTAPPWLETRPCRSARPECAAVTIGQAEVLLCPQAVPWKEAERACAARGLSLVEVGGGWPELYARARLLCEAPWWVGSAEGADGCPTQAVGVSRELCELRLPFACAQRRSVPAPTQR